MMKNKIAAQNKKSLSLLVSTVALGLVTIAYVTGCSIRTPGTETPVPNDQGIEKAFFEEVVTDNVMIEREQKDAKGRVTKAARYERRTVRRPKTFLCGWAPISETGHISQIVTTHAVQMTGHCNIEFEVQENWLMGRMINPSFPNDRTRWKQFVAIPINKHYRYVKDKDTYDRDTNKFVEDTSKDDWSARPYISLDLSQVKILDWSAALLYDSPNGSSLSAEDIEWDKENNFLGFTLNTISPLFGAEHAARFRFNFMAFKHNPNFKPTPYNSQNARYLNALHVLGEKVDGISPILYAARWDLSKKHKVYMHGMPEENIETAKATILEFNKAFKEIGASQMDPSQGPFELSLEPANKYGFDLRYPSMVWVEDPLISVTSPLGVGMALADVKNGEILWGQITLFGGYLERYIKSYLPANQGGEGISSVVSRFLNLAPLGSGFFTAPDKLMFPKELQNFQLTNAHRAALVQAFERNRNSALNTEMQAEVTRINQMLKASEAGQTTLPNGERVMSQSEIQTAQRLISEKLRQRTAGDFEASADKIVSHASAVIQTLPAELDKRLQSKGFASNDELLGFHSKNAGDITRLLGKDAANLNSAQLKNALWSHAGKHFHSLDGAVVMDTDRRFIDVAPGWAAAIQASNGAITYENAYEIVVRELIMHEFGHMVGLGHQFKENILPAEGSIPDSIYQNLRTLALKDQTNATSVMGYRSPTVEIAGKLEDVVPGPQDKFTLRYLYKQEFPVYKRGDADFSYAPVPASGIIPPHHPEKPEYRTAYFPQCNDLQASLSLDPYCNRFDRGYSAETIVKGYLEDLNDNLVSNIYAFTDARGGGTESAESYLWQRSLSTMGRIRLFYDYMRQKYEPQIEQISNSQTDLYEFSRACSGEIAGSSELQRMFKTSDGRETELGELCRVNRMAIRAFQAFMVNPGPDRSRMDWDNSYAPAGMQGGDAQMDYSRMFGTRSALSVTPLKMSAMNALTTARPYMFLGGWMMPIPRYDDGEKGRFSYASLYPSEFTQAIAASLEKNLQFANGQPGSRTLMGQSVLSMGYFLSQLHASNEALRFPREYIETIRLQHEFRVSLAAVLVTFKGRSDQDVRRTHLETTVIDLRTQREIPGGESYLLPGGRLIVRGPNRSFIYPITKIAFLKDDPANTQGYVLAYRIDYDNKHDDLLASHSVKTTLEKLHKATVDACLLGTNNNGLAGHFNAQTKPELFEGFEVLPGVASDENTQIRFYNSIRAQFDKFDEIRNEKRTERLPKIELTCEESLKGLSLIVSSAALLNGYWLPEALDNMVK